MCCELRRKCYKLKQRKMKKNDWLLLVMTGVYSFLFYGEYLGLNLGIFTCVIVLGLVIKDRDVLKNTNWKIIALCSIISAFYVCYYGNLLSIIACYISLLILLGMQLNPKTSVLFSLIYSCYSIVTSPVSLVEDVKNRRNVSGKIKNPLRKLIILIPFLVTYIFFLMYKKSNPIFASYANKINFDWISWWWVFFTLIALFIIYGGLHSQKITSLSSIDETESIEINPNSKNKLIIFGKEIDVNEEYFTGKVLFIMLNILLFFLNAFDVNFLFIDDSLPQGVTFAEILHQGVGMLVISIALSIFIILFYFRGELNFIDKNKTFKILAYIWICQNIIMLGTVSVKNNMYIEQYGLTYKRIGIYIYTLLTFIGLVSTLIKLNKIKKNVFLVRFNGWAFYFVLIISCAINWDKMIIDCDQQGNKQYDVYYLLSLSDSTIPLLLEFEKNISNSTNKKILQRELPHKINHFKKTHKSRTWKSWNYQDHQVNFDTFSYRRTLSLTR